MLENLYTTKMSANKKILQNRFTKIRRKSGRISKIMALVMSCAVAVTMLGATIVMAAVGSDGLEHWDKNEIYFLGSVSFTANTSGKNVPNWVKDDVVGDDGNISVTIRNYQMRRKTRGYVSLCTIAELSGAGGTTRLYSISGGGINRAASFDSNRNLISGGATSSLNYPYSSSYRFIEAAENGGLLEYAKPFVENGMLDSESGKRKCVRVEFGIDEQKNICAIRLNLCLTDEINPYDIQRNDNFDAIDASADSLNIIGTIGDKAEDFFNCGWCMYFTDFERDYRNIENSDVKISVEKAVPEEIIINTDINLENAEYVNVTILDNKNNTVTIQGEPASLNRHTIIKQYKMFDGNTAFNSNEKYRICIGVLDKNNNLLCRWQEYVTIQ